MFGKKSLTVQEFFARRQESYIIDTRGLQDFEPAIPGSRSHYILHLLDDIKTFQKEHDAELRSLDVVLVCSRGDGSEMLRKKFSWKYEVMNLQGGMVAYLNFITRLLAEHPYENPETAQDVSIKLLQKLTDKQTPWHLFRKIADRLLQCSPDPALRQLYQR